MQAYISGLPQEVLATPLGQMLPPMLSPLEQQLYHTTLKIVRTTVIPPRLIGGHCAGIHHWSTSGGSGNASRPDASAHAVSLGAAAGQDSPKSFLMFICSFCVGAYNRSIFSSSGHASEPHAHAIRNWLSLYRHTSWVAIGVGYVLSN